MCEILNTDNSLSINKKQEIIFFFQMILSKRNIYRKSSFNQLKEDPFFKGFNWDFILTLVQKPPFIPIISTTYNLGHNPKNIQSFIKLN